VFYSYPLFYRQKFITRSSGERQRGLFKTEEHDQAQDRCDQSRDRARKYGTALKISAVGAREQDERHGASALYPKNKAG
ncbi:MAG: hypothetical protein ACUVS2_15165, partial [Candidatus Flexifilum sp.]